MDRVRLLSKVLSYINLDSEVDDYDKIHESIETHLVFKGTNLWILVFAIIIASVGLNMNSTAVIIGAMLISPLMGPINGMGYGIATYNFPLFKKAAKNFSFAVITSLIASTTYFAISPISTAHSELLARTSPSIYDVLIAFFGGLAGIVAISCKQKGNVIPGVAIATALMPPLCTAGYGLATGQFSYFFGAFYLFTINTVFIAISSVVTAQLLKFPIRKFVDEQQKKRVNRWISLIIPLVLIPSLYLGYNLVKKEKFIGNASRYINNVSAIEGNFLLKNEINATTKTIRLVYAGETLTDDQKKRIKEKAKDFSLDDVAIEFQQGLSFDEITKKNSEVDNLKLEINRLSFLVKEKDKRIDSLIEKKHQGRIILEEIKTIYPQIIYCLYAESYLFSDTTTSSESQEVIVFTVKGKMMSTQEKEKIKNWLQIRLKTDKLKIYYEQKS